MPTGSNDHGADGAFHFARCSSGSSLIQELHNVPEAAVQQQPIAYVQIRDPQGQISRTPVFNDRVIIGRSRQAHIRLKQDSISRQHAELVRDPFGRWMVRDLESRGGLKVRGNAVKQAVLRFGDKFEIGKFSLKLWNLRPIAPRASAKKAQPKPTNAPRVPSVPVNESDRTSISTLVDIEPPKIDTLHLSTLTEFGQRLTEMEDPAERLQLLCRFMVRKDLRGQCGLIVRVDKKRRKKPLDILAGPITARGWDEKVTHVSKRLIRTVQQTRAPALANDVAATPAGQIDAADAPTHVGHAAVACPLSEDEYTMDVLYVLLPMDYGTSEWLAMISLAATQFQQAESMWIARQDVQSHAAIEQDLASARRIQERLVPRDVEVDSVDFSVQYQPCEWVGGDYVDAVKMKDGRMVFVLADVSGHGLPAALIALSMHSMVHTYLRTNTDLSGLVEGMNEHLCEFLDERSFVTMAAVAIDPQTGALECVNAGHPPPTIFSPDGQPRPLQVSAHYPLGVQANLPFTTQSDKIECGHYLALFSDGLSEIIGSDGKLIGIQGVTQYMSEILQSGDSSSVDQKATRLMTTLQNLETNLLPEDDRSFLLARWDHSAPQ